jgi:hypothetical protein
MPVPTWSPGQILTADDVNNWLTDDAVILTSAQHFTNTTTLANTSIVLPVLANAVYMFTCLLFYQGFTQGISDMKIDWVVPASATLVFHVAGINQNNAALDGNGFSTSGAVTVGLGTNGSGVQRAATVTGTLTTVGTAGNLQMRGSQFTASTTDTILGTGSGMKMTRIG